MTYQDEQKTEVDRFENFDAIYRRERELGCEMEKIEIAYVKTVEKYGEYSDCKAFVEYLRTIEKVFTEAKFRNWDAEKDKQELIKSKIKILASTGTVEEDVLNSINDDFRRVGNDVDKIYEIVNALLEKYKDDSGCKEFILYVQYLFINFQNAEREKIGTDDLKERLVRARMEVLSGSGDPDLITLEAIYKEFRGMIEN